jgi:hypothetical protein
MMHGQHNIKLLGHKSDKHFNMTSFIHTERRLTTQDLQLGWHPVAVVR